MNEAIGVLIVLVGQALALVMRVWPNAGLNRLIPKIVYLANLLGILAGFAQRLVDAIGPVAGLDSTVQMAGWGSVVGFLKFVGSAWIAAMLTYIQGKVWDEGGKKAVPQALLDAGKK